jgi:hypothetical protein
MIDLTIRTDGGGSGIEIYMMSQRVEEFHSDQL